MAEAQTPPAGPDLTQGIALAEFTGETLLGHVSDQEILLVRSGVEIFAIDAHCTHYHGPLAEGLVVGDSIRCPWHHACFNLRSGEAMHAPATYPLASWRVEQEGERETDLLLVWGTAETSHLDEPRIRSRWPQSKCGRNAQVANCGPLTASTACSASALVCG